MYSNISTVRAAGNAALAVGLLLAFLNTMTFTRPVSVYVVSLVLVLAGVGLRLEAAVTGTRAGRNDSAALPENDRD